MIREQLLVFGLLVLYVSLMLFQLVLQEPHKVIGTVVAEFLFVGAAERLASVVGRQFISAELLLLVLVMLQFSLEALNHLLAELSPFGEFFFDLFVDLHVSFQCFNLCLHLVVFVDELLGLLGLVLEFSRKLLILQNSQFCRCL